MSETEFDSHTQGEGSRIRRIRNNAPGTNFSSEPLPLLKECELVCKVCGKSQPNGPDLETHLALAHGDLSD